MENLIMSEVDSGPDVNIRSAAYYIALTQVLCWHCGSMTGVVALGLPPEHETLNLDGEGDDEGDGVSDGEAKDLDGDVGLGTHFDDWQPADGNAFLFYVGSLPESVQSRLRDVSPSFRFAYSEATQNSYWANHCDHCALLLSDYELHCEPEGAFVPLSETAAAGIELLRVEEAFEAAADGYAFEPEFFSRMRGA